MKRKLGVLAALTAGALVLTGCSSSGSNRSGGDTNAAEQTGTLRVLVANFPSNDQGTKTFAAIVDVFHKTYPKVKVESDFAPYDGMNQKISTSLAGGSPYDVISAGIGWVQPMADLGAIQSLTKLGVTKQSVEDSTNPAFVPPMLYKNDVYALPVIANPRVLAYSKSAFTKAGLDPTKPPQSLTELREYAKKLTIRDAGGRITQTGFDFWAPPSNYRQQFVAFMGALGGREFDGETPVFDSPAGVDALTTIRDMVSVDKSSTYGYQNSAQSALVTAGEAAMGFASPNVDCSSAGIGDRCKDLVYFTLKDKQEVQYVGGRTASVGGRTKLPQAALALAKAFTDPQVQVAVSKIDRGVPIGKDAGESECVKSNPASTIAWKDLDKGVFEFGGPTYLDFRAKFGPALDQVILGKAEPKKTLDDLKQVALSGGR
ncbi:extracellular solute-binding protein [Plantactinospora siamensis]|uniref:Extracellular solute-binding protein n=1 Tax=Plantactinospora siamensis TaxID=555372 RepID=A0ABV6NTI2_9ACTN